MGYGTFFSIFLIIMFGVSLAVFAQPDLEYENIFMRHITVKDGLSQRTVNDILKDTQGFIWIATDNGLNRFDGNEFHTYINENDDSTSISENGIHDLFEDSKNRLWVGTNHFGLNLFDRTTEEFKRYLFDPDDDNSISESSVTSMIEDTDGMLWIGSGG